MRRFIYAVLLGWLLVVAVVAAVTFTGFRYASEPGAGKVLNRNRPSPEAYSLWERSFTKEQSAVCSRPRKGAGCSRQRDISERCGRHSQWTTGRHERLRGRPGPAGKGNHQPARRSSVECHDWRSYVSERLMFRHGSGCSARRVDGPRDVDLDFTSAHPGWDHVGLRVTPPWMRRQARWSKARPIRI